MVNYVEYRMENGGETTYRNSWVSDLPISENNVKEVVKIGRRRWKIENETFNTLKNQGYHVEHSFGHGQKQLSFKFFLLNLLAFFMHQGSSTTSVSPSRTAAISVVSTACLKRACRSCLTTRFLPTKRCSVLSPYA